VFSNDGFLFHGDDRGGSGTGVTDGSGSLGGSFLGKSELSGQSGVLGTNSLHFLDVGGSSSADGTESHGSLVSEVGSSTGSS